MSTRWLIGILVSLTATVVCVGTASAAEFRDPKTGLAVDPPAGFTARMGEPSMGDAVEIVVERETPPTSCSVSFGENAANRPFTQQQLNEVASKKEYLDLVRTIMSAMHEIVLLEQMTQDGSVGVVMILKSKMEMLAGMRLYQAFFETPRGRTTIQCATKEEQFEGFRNDYEAIAKSVKLPR